MAHNVPVPEEDQEMELYVETMSGYVFTLDVDSSETIYSLKVRIFTQESIPIVEQRLVYDDNVLDNDSTVAEHMIQNKSTLQLVKSIEEIVHIYSISKRLVEENHMVKLSDQQYDEFENKLKMSDALSNALEQLSEIEIEILNSIEGVWQDPLVRALANWKSPYQNLERKKKIYIYIYILPKYPKFITLINLIIYIYMWLCIYKYVLEA